MTTTTATTTSTLTTEAAKLIDGVVINWLKPRKSVAVARLRSNGFALVVVLLVTQLAPIVPSPATCLWMIATGGSGMSYAMRYLCWTEALVYAVLALNIVQSYVAIRYPPPQFDPSSSPVKRVQLHSPAPAQPLRGFTPKLSLAKSSSASPFASPTSTPPRINKFSLASSTPSPFQSSLNSSLSTSLLSSPLAYRSRHPHAQPARSLRGSLLSQFEAADDDEY